LGPGAGGGNQAPLQRIHPLSRRPPARSGTSPTFGNNAVYIGEIGKPENEAKEADIIEW